MSRGPSWGLSRSGGPGTCRSCTGRAGSARRWPGPSSRTRRGARTCVGSCCVTYASLHTRAGRAFVCATLSPVEPPRTDATRTGRKRVIVVMPAYNAAKTLERTYADIPHGLVDEVILVDDVSHDETVEIARRLGLDVRIHRQNLGYGGNQKTCYDAALAAGADVVVM